MHFAVERRTALVAHAIVVLTFNFHQKKASKTTISILATFVLCYCTPLSPFSFHIHPRLHVAIKTLLNFRFQSLLSLLHIIFIHIFYTYNLAKNSIKVNLVLLQLLEIINCPN